MPPTDPQPPQQQQQPTAAQQLLLKQQQDKASQAMQENTRKASETQKVAEKTFYSNIAGSTHVFKNGDTARFTNGEYVTNRQVEIDELNELVNLRGQHTISDEPMEIQNQNDSIVMREVATNSAGSGTGTVSSAQLAQLASARRQQ